MGNPTKKLRTVAISALNSHLSILRLCGKILATEQKKQKTPVTLRIS